MWRGKFVDKNQAAALNLIDVAVANAPPTERVWIEDIYQNIFCNAGEGVRQQATGRVAEWHNRYGRRPALGDNKDGLGDLAVEPVRTCANGELVRPMGVLAPEAAKPVPLPQMISAPSAVRPSQRNALIPAGTLSIQPATGATGRCHAEGSAPRPDAKRRHRAIALEPSNVILGLVPRIRLSSARPHGGSSA